MTDTKTAILVLEEFANKYAKRADFVGLGEHAMADMFLEFARDIRNDLLPAILAQQAATPAEAVQVREQEAFEGALPHIGDVMHVFSTSALFQPRDGRTYLEGTTELCWRTWRAARAQQYGRQSQAATPAPATPAPAAQALTGSEIYEALVEHCDGNGICIDPEVIDDLSNYLASFIAQKAGSPEQVKSAKQRFDAAMCDEQETPIERLRFFCLLAMSGQDWLDVEPFLDALAQQPAKSAVPAGERETAWQAETAANSGVPIGADYRHWFMKGWQASATRSGAETSEAARNDERYRWLKERNGGAIGIVKWHRDEEKEMVLVDDFADATIDAAIAAERATNDTGASHG